ncbi:MAG: Flp pilus assembly complex ATPase component TadA [Lachnospiraceae bacterium]|nr:Flp pilus assembly complex ATPase component TadA [Lachnospiraceae bacterium]
MGGNVKLAEFGRRKLRLGDILVSQEILTEEQLESALALQRAQGKRLGEVLIESGMCTEIQIAQSLQRQMGLELVKLAGLEVPEEIVNLVKGEMLRRYNCIPIGFTPNMMLKVAMADPMDMIAQDDLAMVTGYEIEPCIATTSEISNMLDKFFGNQEANAAAEAYQQERSEKLAEIEETEGGGDSEVDNSPIVLLVKTMIEQAARQGASDIHIEALERTVRVRYRIDGDLYERMNYDISLLPALIARLKIIGGMDISEKRKPQDGRITQVVDRTEYDIRVSMLPTVYGEKCVMRLAAKKQLKREKSVLGFGPEEMERFDRLLAHPHGIILVTGPTGSGKSTTLYTALSELNKENVNIITVEDPVEANIDGINQVHVNPKADLTFASALRSILRQDPDIIMIGEIRDGETAGIAVQASITGHLVVSTLHTNSASSTVTRLEDMGIESYLIADSVIGIIAQRLVRRLCKECRKGRQATEIEKRMLEASGDVVIYDPAGCPACNGPGYKGRIGVYEILEMSPNLRQLIARGAGADEIKELALMEGMHTLKMSASRLVLEGVTSYSDMIRITLE